MSHFTVLVIGPDPEQQLAPYHEYECTGQEDEYVIDVDRTEEVLENYKGRTETMLVRTSDGKRFEMYADEFHREPTEAELEGQRPFGLMGTGGGRRKDGTRFSFQSQDWGDGKGHRAKVHFIPEGYEKVEVPIEEVEPIADWIVGYYGGAILKPGEEKTEEHKYGYTEVDENGEVIRSVKRTNPNAQWDWYQLGGRWRGFFPLKTGVNYDEKNLGEPGTGESMSLREGKGPDANYEAERRVDTALLSQVDFEHARYQAGREGRDGFAKWKAIFEKHGKPELSWPKTYKNIEAEIVELKEKGIRDEMVPNPDPNENHELNREGLARHIWRQRYHEQPAIAAAQELRMWDCPVEKYGFDEDVYAQKCRDRALAPFAIIKDGKWFAKGDMGWWGAVSNAKDEDKWGEELARLYDDLPPDTLLSLYDCHI